MSNTKAIVTLAIGDTYRQNFEQHCRSGWRKYAQKHGYDVIVLDHVLDDSERARKRSPAWQKCLVLALPEVCRYERVVWMDSDILINDEISPCVCEGVPLEKVGAVDAYGTPSPELYRVNLQRKYDFWKAQGVPYIDNLTPQQYYSMYGLAETFDKVVQTGVLVLSPEHHRHILKHVYDSYEERGGGEWNYEMRPLSYEFMREQNVHWLDFRFNMPWSYDKWRHYPFLLDTLSLFDNGGNALVEKFCRKFYYARFREKMLKTCATTSFRNAYFLHFAGCANEMGLVDQTGEVIPDPLRA